MKLSAFVVLLESSEGGSVGLNVVGSAVPDTVGIAVVGPVVLSSLLDGGDLAGIVVAGPEVASLLLVGGRVVGLIVVGSIVMT